MQLPKKYLSYSAIDLWQKNKEGFRDRYYRNIKTPETPEMIFGKKIAQLLEKNDPSVAHVPRYHKPEHKLEVMIEDVPMIGYIDCFDPIGLRIYEYKTGRPKSDGKPRWDPVEVQRSEQLPMYSLFIKEKYGDVEDLCHLIYLQTKFVVKTINENGLILSAVSNEVELDGHMKMFSRVIREYERKAMREKIIRCANEISEDYEAYKKTLVTEPIREAVLAK